MLSKIFVIDIRIILIKDSNAESIVRIGLLLLLSVEIGV